MSHVRYLRYVLRHKWFVFVAGIRTGAPVWRLVIHDWSKFLPGEWFPYVAYFYGPGVSGDPRGADASYNPASGTDAFNAAWLHHQHLNPHHWQHWVLREDDGGTKALPMPEHFVREMVADWIGAGRAQGHGDDVRPWYTKNRRKMALHAATETLVRELLA